MAVDNDLSFKKWNIVREQLICLKAFYKVTKINDDLSKILTEVGNNSFLIFFFFIESGRNPKVQCV